MAVFNVPTRLAFQTILVATSFSASSRPALAWAGAVARRAGGKVIVAHVKTPRWQVVNPHAVHPALCQPTRSAEKKLCSLLKSADLRGVEIDTLLKEGDFREVLCSIAHERGAELLVVGTKGRRGLGKLLFGSTAEDVCRVAPCPIVLVGPKVGAEQEPSISRILFPTDLSAPSLGALPIVLALAEQHESKLRLVRMLEEGGDDGGREFALKQLESEFGPLLTHRTRLSHEPEFAVETGPAAASIRRIAREWPADLIAVGTHRPGTLASHLPGDLVYDIACDAHCPVLTISD
ncbi:MAG TPA: universal stress protein [Terriglobales bacterium]|nr:universal stress protein [Terriglobales bacterium]